ADAATRLRAVLRTTPDIARALARLSLNRGGPRDLAAIRDGLAAAEAAAGVLQGPLPIALQTVRAALPAGLALAATLRDALADPAPLRLDNGARFTTPDLSDLDRRISEAGERAAARERAVFGHLVEAVLRQAHALAACADALAFLDAAQSAAKLAEPGTWCRPVVTDDDTFQVTAGRHPVVQAALSGKDAFVPNHCDLSPDRRVLLLTGPNMAGKSTFLRQNALIAVLAQAGLPVPAEAARIGVVDRLFSRVGASDDMARGRSTFMVEMTETAAILHQAGPRSLVVVDEIGR